MLHHPTVDKLYALRLGGMAAALVEQQSQEGIDRLCFEERLGLLVEREASERESRQTTARLRRAKLKFADAVPEDIDYRTVRGLDRTLTARLLTCEWVRRRQNLILIAPTGLGKSWLACAFAVQACRQGFSVAYLRMPKLSEELALVHGSGGYARWLAQVAKTDIVILDDLAMTPLADSARRDLLEVLDDRHGSRSTMATSQLPVDNWHAAIGEPTVADAILDRLVHNAHRLTLNGESMRKTRGSLTATTESE
jgi:DNA replication protein DnaC